MKSFLLVSSVLLICGSYAIPEHYGSRIIGGTDVNIGEFPSVVSLQKKFKNGRYWFCGGTILDETHILTSAKCVYNDRSKPTEIWVQYGVTELINPLHLIQVNNIVIHPDYQHKNNFPNDVAVLKLSSAIQFGETAQPVQLPISDAPTIVGAIAKTVGWGNTKITGTPSQKLQGTDVVIMDDGHCETIIKTVRNIHLCGNSGVRGTCNGDSGGPLFYQGVQIGINSWQYNGCGSIYPDAFARTARFVNWIYENLK